MIKPTEDLVVLGQGDLVQEAEALLVDERVSLQLNLELANQKPVLQLVIVDDAIVDSVEKIDHGEFALAINNQSLEFLP